uniref:Uncharacterized protein n=1 Tax=Euplotes crassus TaxID=5936 RepID=A0A7S3NSS9_EUPCR|mmetsp:Transcript_17310/g.16981  ORF Transcript_17310/g.16981 Transcript_17310/m.16981 type:complete len:113 (+) Transcript_17310:810-1148(+)
MKISINNHSDIKLNDSVELAKFNEEKLKNFNLNRISAGSRDSKSSDMENPEIFKPTTLDMHDDDNSDNDERRPSTNEGVDEYDGNYDQRHKKLNSNPQRNSLGSNKYEFEGI